MDMYTTSNILLKMTVISTAWNFWHVPVQGLTSALDTRFVTVPVLASMSPRNPTLHLIIQKKLYLFIQNI